MESSHAWLGASTSSIAGKLFATFHVYLIRSLSRQHISGNPNVTARRTDRSSRFSTKTYIERNGARDDVLPRVSIFSRSRSLPFADLIIFVVGRWSTNGTVRMPITTEMDLDEVARRRGRKETEVEKAENYGGRRRGSKKSGTRR